jgi:hypothetical protein
MDQFRGRLLAKLDELGVAERTWSSSRGTTGRDWESTTRATHGMFLYNTTQHVPLLIRVPGGKQRRISGIVRHIDLAPTVLDFLGIAPSGAMQGSSLIPVINGTETSGRTAYAESLYAQHHYGWSALTSLTTNRYDFIQSPKSELFDRKDDPGQLRNLIHDREPIALDLAEQLRGITEQYTRKDLEVRERWTPIPRRNCALWVTWVRRGQHSGKPEDGPERQAAASPRRERGHGRLTRKGLRKGARARPAGGSSGPQHRGLRTDRGIGVREPPGVRQGRGRAVQGAPPPGRATRWPLRR